MNNNVLVVNLFGTPSAGKSTGAAYIFAMLKMNGVNAELVTEFAKDKVWENNKEAFKNQAYIFGKQCYRLSRCADKVDVIITDSPLPLNILYNQDERLTENFNQTVMDVFNSYHNLNYCINRTKEYNPVGRWQSEDEANKLSKDLFKLFTKYNIDTIMENGDKDGYDTIVDEVLTFLRDETTKNSSCNV